MKSNYITPSEIIFNHPEISWTPQELGYLLLLRLVDGKKYPRTCIINEEQVLELHKQKKMQPQPKKLEKTFAY